MHRELVVGVNKPCNLMEWTSELRTEQFLKVGFDVTLTIKESMFSCVSDSLIWNN